MNSLGRVDRAPVELSDSLARIALSYHIYDAGQKLSNAETCTILGVVGYTVGGLLLVKNMSVGNIFIAGGGVLSLSSVILRLKAGYQLKNAGQKIRYLKK